ncbi:beta-glucosidase [Listeria floridensis FSL S10-1187]|uniref:Beta-glucosidase n=1 Tax=Listeria floridensis FSL S10-1187 TaxID=1265817 RepID=A0ABP3AW88_9LIST|nr:glycoside hydrolase family 3 protein [Listeria floridensis]EUJ29136.1 beta-glucosidase [Listeria floridensis FSL S10-1187]
MKKKIGVTLGWTAFLGAMMLFPSISFAASEEPSYGINIQQVIFWITAATVTIAAALLILSIYRMIKLKKTRKIWWSIMALLLVVVVTISIAVNSFALIANTYMSKSQIDETKVEQARGDAKLLTRQMEAEGIVMLENKKNILPLQKGNVNVFGYSSRAVVYGGSGSGGGKEFDNITLQQGLKNAGFKPNPKLTKFYDKRYVPREKVNIHKLVGGDFNSHEPKTSEYSSELLKSARDYSDTALVVFSRNSGEGADIATDMEGYAGGTKGKHYLELTKNEEAMLEMVKTNFKKVVILVNSSYPMELGFLKDDKIQAALWIGNPGSTGFDAVGSVLNGETNPSGRLVDTYAYDATSAPSYYNIGEFPYKNSTFKDGDNTWHYKYIDYAEGIYVGYRYYETRYVDNKTGKVNEAAYQKSVQYPFGYGLSYSRFSQKIVDYKADNKTITLKAAVKNEGTMAGKEVAQVYFTPPYSPGGIEKPHVVLADFGKTKLLKPGETEILTLKINVEDMASYDDQHEKAYLLEKGDYQIKLMNNAHDLLDQKEYQVPKTIIYGQTNKRKTDQIAATNQFDDSRGDVKYVSRADWEGTLPKQVAKPKEASKKMLQELKDFSVHVDKNAKPIKFKDHGLSLYDLKGLDYDDPKWEKLLEQLSVKDMNNLISYGGFQTVAVNSVKKPATIDSDGPAGINQLVSGAQGNQYASEVVMASTWNKQLAEEVGESLGVEAKASNITGLYLPGVNLHRSPFAGRNFEYYSEDPILSGEIGKSVAVGAQKKGSYTFMKHFAMYDQETKRYEYPTGATTWATEQSMREVYLKPFEIAVKEGHISGIMSSYNRLGTTWVGVSKNLLKTVLRDEWGFKGTVITDFYKPQYMNVDEGLAAGNDLVLYVMPIKLKKETTETNWGQQNMRTASHNILYTVVNSHAYDVVERSIPTWVILYTVVNSHAYDVVERSIPTWVILYAIGDLLLLTFIGYMMYRLTNSKKSKRKKKKKTNCFIMKEKSSRD